MEQVSERLQRLEESATIVMAQKSRELKARGLNVIDLSLGEPDFLTPAHICAAAKRAIDEGYHHYPPVAGYPDLRAAISEKFQHENGLDYAPEQIVVSTGAKQSLANIMLSILNEGDEVIVPAPYWVSYSAQIKMAGANLRPVSAGIESDFKISPEQLRATITAKSRIFLFSSPCNPTGSVYSPSELEALASVLREYPRILIVSDEIYEHINFSGRHHSIGSLPGLDNRVITVNGVSKGYAMTGWRLGYMGAPLWVAKACTKMQGQFTSGANSIAQRAALEALTGDLKPTHKMREAFRKRRDLMIEKLSIIEGMQVNVPQGAFYLFPDVHAFLGKSYKGKQMATVDELALVLLEEALVSTVTGRAFGDEHCIRLSYANSEEKLLIAAERMQKFFSEIK